VSKKLMLLVGPPGSGKSSFAKKYEEDGFVYINQDLQGKEHLHLFDLAVLDGKDVIVDRLNFSKGQRARYLDIAKKHGYETAITVFHESHETCLERCKNRKDHATIKDLSSAGHALNMFFSKYERVSDDEADTVQRLFPDGYKPLAIICDLDGTLCEIGHRLHFVKRPELVKKDWKSFFENIPGDSVNKWCADILENFGRSMPIVLCTGRPDNYRKHTTEWLDAKFIRYEKLLMRNRGDQRQDSITKEVILDFEILTRYTPYFMIDDRQSVVDMWRKRGYTCLQCAPGDF